MTHYTEICQAIVTQSDKNGLIAHCTVSRNAGLKYLVCCSSQMVAAMSNKFSHTLHQFFTFKSIHSISANTTLLGPAILDSF